MSYIVITGSSGLLGSSIVRLLQKKKIKIINISNNKRNKKSIFVDYASKSSINKFIEKFGLPYLFIHSGWGKMSEPLSEYHIKENYRKKTDGLRTV